MNEPRAGNECGQILGDGHDHAHIIDRSRGTLAPVWGPVPATACSQRQNWPRRRHAKAISAAVLAKRWAAKEACSKALGTGLSMGIAWRSMWVTNLASGQPIMHVTGWAEARLRQMTPPGHSAFIHVTITDDHPWAQAFVVIEARPA